MTVDKYWSVIVKQWKLVAICTIVVGLGTFLGSRLITPVYQASVLVQVTLDSSNSSAVYNNLLASDQLVQTEAQLATSDPVLREVASHYAGLTPETLASDTTATAKLNTELFEIDVQSTNALRAAQLANDVANTLIKQQLMQTQMDAEHMRQQYQQEIDSTRRSIDANNAKISNLQAQIAAAQGDPGRV
ncbi:MAG TPA: Wzz/FepE/Etk N-terminal domain-containing protein, partial [Ktedonobacteraceae bacterium]